MSQHIVSLYDNQASAIEAINLLKNAGFTEKQISLLGKTDVGDDIQVKDANVAAKGIGIGALVGVLAGIGLTLIPGIGILYGIGAVAGAVAGFDIGVIGGTVVSTLAIASMGKEVADKYSEELKAGKVLLAVAGDADEIRKARAVLESHGIHTEINEH
jgi:hypothetical protein